jgi:DNA-binding CsgD family transcriptional regulator
MPAPNADALTRREQEVLGLIRLGLTNEEIAERLGITLDGAKYHVSQILSKLGVATREEAAGAAVVVAAVAGLAVLAWGVLETNDHAQVSPLPSPIFGKVFYLAPSDQAKWIASPELVKQAGIIATEDTDEFMRQSQGAPALIIDRDYLNVLDGAWVREQVSAGKLLMGVRINLSELSSGFNLGFVVDTGFGYYPSSRVFYSAYQKQACWHGSSEGRGQDYLDRNSVGQFRLLLARIKRSTDSC